jgi:very-short-patch-repair endonuclease
VERRGVRFTSPALTALDLCDELGGDGIDTALRTRAATLNGMRAAIESTRGRAGNHHRRRLLLDSRDEPWSAAERLIHRLLRAAGITGWRANLAVPTLGSIYYLDVGFERQMLAVEIDGRLHETDRGTFESDRWRQNQLVLQGWRVLRFTWSMLTQHPELVIQAIRQALALKR